MSGEFDSRKDSQSTRFERRPRIFVKVSFREFHHRFQKLKSEPRNLANTSGISGLDETLRNQIWIGMWTWVPQIQMIKISHIHNHLVCKQTFNHLAKLVKWLGCVLRTYLYGAFDCMLLSCHLGVLEWIVVGMSRNSLLETDAIFEV